MLASGVMTLNPSLKDRLERDLAVGDCVVYVDSGRLEIGSILKITPKMVKVARVGSRGYWSRGTLKYPNDLVKLEGQDLTLYLLKNAS